MIDVTVEKTVAQLVGHAEPLKSLVRNVRGIEDAEGVPVPQQHPGHARLGVWLRLHYDVVFWGDLKRIDRQACDLLFGKDRLAGFSGSIWRRERTANAAAHCGPLKPASPLL